MKIDAGEVLSLLKGMLLDMDVNLPDLGDLGAVYWYQGRREENVSIGEALGGEGWQDRTAAQVLTEEEEGGRLVYCPGPDFEAMRKVKPEATA